LKKDGELLSKFKPRKYEELKANQRGCINYSVFYLGLFFAILFNYILTLYMGALMAYGSELAIRLFDKIGVEVHFIRLIYNTVFDVDLHERFHYQSPFTNLSLVLDLVFLLIIILPLFVMSMRYLTYPVYEGPYQSKWNALIAPLGVLPAFFFTDMDILYLSILVTAQNLWVAWKQLDGGDDVYTWAQFYRDEVSQKSSRGWQQEKVAAETFETISLLSADPLTSQNFGMMYR
jgi:hypothetical protein